MGAFEDLHRDHITGSLAMFDRMIFKGYFPGLYKHDGARAFLWKQGVELRDFTAYAKASTERIANNAPRSLARRAPPSSATRGFSQGFSLRSTRSSRRPQRA